MAEKLKTVAYAAVITASVAAIAVAALSASAITQPPVENELVFQADLDTILKYMTTDGAYVAMLERYPGAYETHDIQSQSANVDVAIIDAETGNKLRLWVYSDPWTITPQTGADCLDPDGNIMDSSVGMSTVEFIKSTDCVSPP